MNLDLSVPKSKAMLKKKKKNDRGLSKGHRNQIEAILVDQIWELQNNDNNGGNPLNKTEIH